MTDTTANLAQKAPLQARHPRKPLSFFGGVARRTLHRALAQLHEGAVTIVDGDDVHTFGRAAPGLGATVTVHDPRFYARALFSGSLGAAEAYIDGLWSCDDLTALCRVFTRNTTVGDGMDRGISRLFFAAARGLHWLRRNSQRGSRRNIAAHYDLGNEFFSLWLDDTMTYSSGVFERPDATLRDASIAKLDRVCQRLGLTAADHVLEIGTGWGSFAIHAASNYGCRVTTATISREQHSLAVKRVAAAGLSDRVTVLLKDYRDLKGQYDKLVSIEMIEAVGHALLDTYFKQCAALLKPDGAMMLQVITMNDQRYDRYLKTIDFIQHYIFPGSCCPSLSAMTNSIARSSDFKLSHLEDFGPHYARTLRCWRERFFAAIDEVRAMGYDERFVRMWDYYLSYCEAGFAERYIGVAQVLLTKPRWRLEAGVP